MDIGCSVACDRESKRRCVDVEVAKKLRRRDRDVRRGGARISWHRAHVEPGFTPPFLRVELLYEML